MPLLPIMPHLDGYRGTKQNLRRKAAEYNAMARTVADHVNILIANNSNAQQQYIFAMIAHDLNLTTDEVRSAISDGGHNGITIGITEEDRRALARYKR